MISTILLYLIDTCNIEYKNMEWYYECIDIEDGEFLYSAKLQYELNYRHIHLCGIYYDINNIIMNYISSKLSTSYFYNNIK